MPRATADSPPGVLATVMGGTVLGILAVAFVISFSAIVYTGPAAAFLAQGIAHALLGATIMLIVASAFYSMRSVVCQPQDVTAIVIAGSVGGLGTGASTEIGATTAALVATATLVTGLAMVLAGRFQLGRLVRLMPYPVIAGFLAATGYLLVMGAIGMSLKSGADLMDPVPLLLPGAVARWVPWIALGLAVMLLDRVRPHDLLLPAALALGAAAFYLWLALAGYSLADATRLDLLLGPFDVGGFARALDPAVALGADWGKIAAQAPMLLSLVALAILGSMLNGAGIEAATGRELDAERDLRATGRANIAAALVGGLPGYQLIGETLLGHKLRLRGWQAPLFAAGFCMAGLLAGASVLGLLPIGLFAAVIAYLGFDLLASWLWDQRARLDKRDLAIVFIILAVAAAVGFLEALVVGCLTAMVLFLDSYSRLDVVRLRSTARHRRSRVERPAEVEDQLALAGADHVLLELEGFVFFGTAHALRARVKDELAGTPRAIVLDFARVTGLDASAEHAVGRIATDCARVGVPLYLSASSLDADRLGDAGTEVVFTPSLDAALERLETNTLGRADNRPEADTPLAALCARVAADPRATRHAQLRDLEAGDVLVARGADDRQIFVLLDGRIRAEVDAANGAKLRVAVFTPGALMGELAYYAGRARTADLIAEVAAQVLVLDLDGLGQDTPELAAEVHRAAARTLATRLARTTALIRDAGL